MSDYNLLTRSYPCGVKDCGYHATSLEALEAHIDRAHSSATAWAFATLQAKVDDMEDSFRKMIDAAKIMAATDTSLVERMAELATELAVVIERMDELEERENARQV